MYPQMILCFSFCWLSHLGHLYCTYSYSNPYLLAYSGRNSFRWGDRKFLSTQNLTLASVWRMVLSIMILSSLSYRWPEARQKMFRVLSSSSSPSSLDFDPEKVEASESHSPPPSVSEAESASNSSSFRLSGFFCTRNLTILL